MEVLDRRHRCIGADSPFRGDLAFTRFKASLRIACAAWLIFVSAGTAMSDQPLHVRIDNLVSGLHPGPESPLCSDGEFLRRIYLDLLGTIPTSEEARQFLADESPDKRARIIDQLLASPEHARHMAHVFDVMLMERRADKYVKKDQWDSYLLASFQQNKPLNEFAREILGADGVDEKQRGPAKFYLDREVEPNLLTREVGRMFFGMDLQCAQCHDHPAIDDYYQADYYGLFAFVNRSYLFQPDKKKPAVLAEKAEGEAQFKSVFTDEEGSTLPRLPGSVEIDEPTFAKEDGYQVKPDPKQKDVRPVPKYSRRQQLAIQATDGSNTAFNRNLANRLWAHMMGRGLVHPVDQHHSGNPPVQPQLLEMLANELPTMSFDLKSMLRQLALSRTYQRSIDLPEYFADHARGAREQLTNWQQRLTELETSVEMSDQRVYELDDQLDEKQADLPGLVDAEKKKIESLAASRKAADEAAKAMNDEKQSLAKHQNALQFLSDSFSSASKAADVLAEDKRLGDAIGLLQKRREAIQGKAAEQTKKIEALSSSHQAAQAKLTEAVAAAEEAMQQLKVVKDEAAPIAKNLADAKQQLLLDQTAVSHASKQISRLNKVVAYGNLLQQHETLQTETKGIPDRISGFQATVAKLTPELEGFRQRLATAETAHAQATAEVADAKKQLESAGEAAKLVSASIAEAKQAAKLVADDAELNAAIGKLEASSIALSTKVDSLGKAFAEATAGEEQLATKAQTLRQQMMKANQDLQSASTQLAELQSQYSSKVQQLSELAETLQTAREELTTAWSEQFSVAVMQRLAPEQLAWSTLRATGFDDRQRASVEAALNKKSPLKPEEQKDQAKVAAREQEIEKQTQAKLDAIIGRFVKLFASAPGQPQDAFFATVDQALFFRNGGEVRSWLTPTGGNLTDRLWKTEDARMLAEELYLSILTRMPTDEEVKAVTEYLGPADTDKQKAVQDMAWALLTSTEFRFQH